MLPVHPEPTALAEIAAWHNYLGIGVPGRDPDAEQLCRGIASQRAVPGDQQGAPRDRTASDGAMSRGR